MEGVEATVPMAKPERSHYSFICSFIQLFKQLIFMDPDYLSVYVAQGKKTKVRNRGTAFACYDLIS